MKRQTSRPRPEWEKKVEHIGLTFHSPGGTLYWDESACYELTSREVEILESAGNELHQRCLEVAQHVIDHDRFGELGIPAEAIPYIKNSWERDDFSLYGRFDLAFDGANPPKLLEYNADTPTALVEAAVAQWYWLEDTHPHRDQFNSLHERLIAAWQRYSQTTGAQFIYLGGERDHLEDQQTVLYIEDTCHQAGLAHQRLAIQDVGLNRYTNRLVDLAEKPIDHFFKLYPWEWIWNYSDQLAGIKAEKTRFLEPIRKMLLSNKGLLPILWELFPGHPNLLPSYFAPDHFKPGEAVRGFVQKPKLSREGANVSLIEGAEVKESTAGEYGQEGFVYQELASIPEFDGNRPVMGVWIIDHECGGLGIREDKSRITANCSRFVPHFF